jgi:hypothetical protein
MSMTLRERAEAYAIKLRSDVLSGRCPGFDSADQWAAGYRQALDDMTQLIQKFEKTPGISDGRYKAGHLSALRAIRKCIERRVDGVQVKTTESKGESCR